MDLSALPRQTQEMIELIGLRDTLALMQARGGLPLYIPLSAAKAGVLREILPTESVMILCQSHLRGTTLELPQAGALLRLARNEEIRASAECGCNNWELAKRHGLTRRQIINIKQNTGSDDDPNLSLF